MEENRPAARDVNDCWIYLAYRGNSWESDTYYLNPLTRRGKVTHYKVTYWGHHDECDDEEYDYFCSVESLLNDLANNREAVDQINRLIGMSEDEVWREREKQTDAYILLKKLSGGSA